MGEDEVALEVVCSWLSFEAGLRKTVVDGARVLLQKEEVYDVRDLAELWGAGGLERVFPAKVTLLKVERALQRRAEEEDDGWDGDMPPSGSAVTAAPVSTIALPVASDSSVPPPVALPIPGHATATTIGPTPSCPDVGGHAQAVQLITHHKAGTVAGMSLYLGLCNETPTAHKLDSFFSSADPPNASTFQSVRGTCKAVTFHANGLSPRALSWALTRRPCDAYIHLVRNPIDTLVSGYLYHRKCAERWTHRYTERPSRYPARPHRLPLRRGSSYCGYLRNASLRDGLAMEMNRSLYATDGIGNMMQLLPMLDRLGASTLCLNNLSSYLPRLSALFQRNLSIVDMAAHHSDHDPEVIRVARAVWFDAFGAHGTELCRKRP